MSDNLPALPSLDLKVLMNSTLSLAEQAEMRTYAMERVEVKDFDRPIPRFFTYLPMYENNQAIRDAISAQVFTAEDPDYVPDEDGTISFQELKGKTVTVNSIAVRPSTEQDGWGAYLLCAITVGDDPTEIVANTGAQDIVTRLALAWMKDELPLRGYIGEKNTNSSAKNRPLRFTAEKNLG